ncbi:nucleotidyl transferase AbiEii/AbiGii toxin family protein [Eggerthella lenta]|uniref:nucleotidyl transferase AbiEii/AbiGii toxin family protein n=1 Tax=Eggerthella lenta TaxID=84112 RepID=UPI00216158C2|nr:nucleotidyl transferase AbiEii/AbiGii toxin family protein [Eggerthella lenta]
MLQQVVDDDNACRFSLKGGTLLQHVFGLASRATKDIDGPMTILRLPRLLVCR